MYPTVSEQTTPIANLDIEPAQTSIANYQAARFSQVCNVYAPMYRQVTLRAILSGGSATVTPKSGRPATPTCSTHGTSSALRTAARFRPDRAFAGSGVLKRLIREQIDPDPQVREKMVSALLIGSSVAVPTGKRKGGDFSNTPICTGKNRWLCDLLCVLRGEAPRTASSAGAGGTAAGCPVRSRLHQPGRAEGRMGQDRHSGTGQADPRSAGRRCGDPVRRYPAEGQDRVVDAEGPVPRRA